jgi:hypothetical protein
VSSAGALALAPSAAARAAEDSAVSGASAAPEAEGGAVDAAAAAAAALEAEDSAVDAILSEARRAGLVLPDGGGVLAALLLSPLVCPVLPTSPPCCATFELHNCSREDLPLLLSVDPPQATSMPVFHGAPSITEAQRWMNTPRASSTKLRARPPTP